MPSVREHRYRIIVAGRLGEVFCSAFDEFAIEALDGRTALVGDMDQAALYGALIRVQSLGLELVELTRVAEGPD